METRELQQAAASKASEPLDIVEQTMYNLMRDVNNYATEHGHDDPLAVLGYEAIDEMKKEVARLREERRQLRQQPTARAS